MMKKYINVVVVVSCVVVLLEIFLNRTMVFHTISYSLKLWVSSIIPALFPFFVISDILIHYNVAHYVPKRIRKTLASIFNISDNGVVIFLLSLISGFPSNARNARTMYDKKMIDKVEASHILTFTHFSNPLFIMGTVAIFFLKSEMLGLIILIAHYSSNLIIGISLRKYNCISNLDYTLPENKSQNFFKVFINSIKNSIDTLLTILGTLTCFLVLSSIIINRFQLGLYNSALLKGILEMTMGLKSISDIMIGDCYKVVLSAMFISFGGLSVHMQVLSFLIDTDISYKPFFVSRMIHALLAGAISYLFYIFFV